MKLPDVLILAGGKAERLGKISKDLPKSLINFFGKPFIYYQLQLLQKKKFKKVILCTGFLSDKIEKYLYSLGDIFDLNILISNDGKQLLGTGGAIKKALPILSNSFFVIFGDSYLNVSYLKIYKKFLYSKKLGLMTIYKNNNLSDLTGEGLSDVELTNGQIIEYNKKKINLNMKYINYGISVFNKNLFNKFNFNGQIDMQIIHQKLIQKKQLSNLIIKKNFYEIGSKRGIKLTRKYLKTIV